MPRGGATKATDSGAGERFVPDAFGSTRRLLVLLGLVLLGLAGIAESLVARGPLQGIYVAYLFPAVGALYVIAGVLAWQRRPLNRLGMLLVAFGAATIVSGYANSGLREFVVVGAVVAALPLAILVHLVNVSPTGVLLGRPERLTVAAAYVVTVLLQIPIWAFTPEQPPFDAVMIAPRANLAELGRHIQQAVGAVVVLATLWLVGRRLRSYARADRPLLATVLAFALLAAVITDTGKSVLTSFGLDVVAVADVQLAAAAVVPLGFLLVVLRGGFVRPVELQAFTQVAAAPAGSADARRELDRAVAAALGDPTAVLLRWTNGGYVDAMAVPSPIDEVGALRSVYTIVGHDVLLGAVVYDTLLGTDPAALGAVVTVVGIALERERLAREVSDSRAELQEASRRVLRADDDERRRVARDLHDGLQGALVLLSLHARELARDTSGNQLAQASKLADGLDAAAVTLRDLVAGVVPSALVERGLGGALNDLLDAVPIPVHLTLDPVDLSLPAQVETTAYFVLAEAITNVVKHANATKLSVCVRLRSRHVSLEVVDDGAGSDTYNTGSGLMGIRDRLAILGGTLDVTGGPAGTRVKAHLPCG